MNQTIVVALGGNALGKSPQEQLSLIKNTAKSIVDLVEEGNKVVVTHGNGPQVGMIKVATDTSATHGGGTPSIPFAECGAMSQGYIGYHLQQAIDFELKERGREGQAVSIVTQTLVDANDAAFKDPTKPVGAFFTEEEAKKLRAESGDIYVEDAGRGFRRVVASPAPIAIVESPVVSTLVDQGFTVIASGGGGVPVIKTGSELHGVDAVIDKDRTAALMATELNADLLLILTAVDEVYVGYNTPKQRALSQMDEAEARALINAGEFARGSMLPKVDACLEFVSGHPGKKAVITSLIRAKDGVRGKAGTAIIAGANGK
ncbi:carbamate kinase [Arcanobacterium ihumii]|uniref:carbamate kinase n=1 Tax=Arcanobacterium ihumii TaxID=2138162 RepID=UPI000F53CE19|nr:carbamate kinase [Arcanobacterium ihumii]